MKQSTIKAMNISSLLEVVSLPHHLLGAAVQGYKTAMKRFACIT